MRSARTRPSVSVGPPAGNGTTTTIGRVGNDCARAKRELNKAAVLPPSQCRSVRRENFITPATSFGLEYTRFPAAVLPDFCARFRFLRVCAAIPCWPFALPYGPHPDDVFVSVAIFSCVGWPTSCFQNLPLTLR